MAVNNKPTIAPKKVPSILFFPILYEFSTVSCMHIIAAIQAKKALERPNSSNTIMHINTEREVLRFLAPIVCRLNLNKYFPPKSY